MHSLIRSSFPAVVHREDAESEAAAVRLKIAVSAQSSTKSNFSTFLRVLQTVEVALEDGARSTYALPLTAEVDLRCPNQEANLRSVGTNRQAGIRWLCHRLSDGFAIITFETDLSLQENSLILFTSSCRLALFAGKFALWIKNELTRRVCKRIIPNSILVTGSRGPMLFLGIASVGAQRRVTPYCHTQAVKAFASGKGVAFGLTDRSRPRADPVVFATCKRRFKDARL